MTLEQEFSKYSKLYKAKVLFEKALQYYNDLDTVDIPEFCKRPEDKNEYKADKEVCRIIEQGDLDEMYNKLITYSLS